MAKKIGIISDTHGLLRPEVLEILKTCDCILHAGDVDRPEILDQLRPLGNLYAVRGNNDGDWARGMGTTLRFKIENISFFMTHNKKMWHGTSVVRRSSYLDIHIRILKK